MIRRGARLLASAAGMAAITQMAFAWMAEQGIAPPPPLTAEEREAGRRMIRRSRLRGNARLIARTVLEEANEHGIAVLSHGDLALEAGCCTRTSKRRVPELDGTWATVIRPPIYASSRRAGQPGQLVFVWRPSADVQGLRDAAPPRARTPRPKRDDYRGAIDRFVADPEGRPPAQTSAGPEVSAEERALVLEHLGALAAELPSSLWTSDAFVAELLTIAETHGRKPAHVAGAAQGLLKVLRSRRADGKRPATIGWAQERLREFTATQLMHKVPRRVAAAATPAGAASNAPSASAPDVAHATPDVSHAALGRAVLGAPTVAGAAAVLAALRQPRPTSTPSSAPPAPPAIIAERRSPPDKPPD